jgi:hypothetical protein
MVLFDDQGAFDIIQVNSKLVPSATNVIGCPRGFGDQREVSSHAVAQRRKTSSQIVALAILICNRGY